MMAEHRYSLEKYSGPKSRHTCPSCHKSNRFTFYIDTVTGQNLAADVGICNRRDGCGYHKPPRKFFQNTITHPEEKISEPNLEIKPVSYIPIQEFQKTLSGWKQTNLAKFLIRFFSLELVGMVMNLYMVGQAKKDGGKANIFWQADIEGEIRTGKIMCYNEDTGKRRKEEGLLPSWIHTAKTILQPFNLHQCFYGENFLNQFPSKKVMIVESEKTALIAAIYMPEFIWMATGGVSGVKWKEYAVNKVLQNRTVELFPDYGFFNKKEGVTCYDKWKEVAEHIESRLTLKIKVNRILEDNLKEEDRERGLDLADFLLNTAELSSSSNQTQKRITPDEWWEKFFDSNLIK